MEEHNDSDERLKCADNSSGGIRCLDTAYVDRLRGVKWEILKMVGQRIMNGNFNLTTISFPIKVCKP